MILINTSDLTFVPKRIISLVPSQTELLAHFGLEEKVIGITKFCVHPKSWQQSKTIIGGTKNVHIPDILALQPDLVIANKEENNREQVLALAETLPVWLTDVNDLEGACSMIQEIGALTGTEEKSIELVKEINNRFSNIIHLPGTVNTAYLIWRKPFMTVGGDTFINDMLKHCGLTNIFSHQQRYPEITVDDLAKNDCRILLLSSEPYPFKEKHIQELRAVLPNTRIMLVDGEMFSWYGSRLLEAPISFNELLARISLHETLV